MFSHLTLDRTQSRSLVPSFTGNKVCEIVRCFRCQKPRCLYSAKPLTSVNRKLLQEVKDTTEFACNTAFLRPGHVLEGKVYMKNLDCTMSVEKEFYHSVFAIKDVCSVCGGNDAEELKRRGRNSKVRMAGPQLPLCKKCQMRQTSFKTR